MAEEIDLEKCNFQNFRGPMTLTLTLDRVTWHTVVHQSSTSIYTPNFIEIGKTFCGRTDGRTYWQTFQNPPLMLLGLLGAVNLKTVDLGLRALQNRAHNRQWSTSHRHAQCGKSCLRDMNGPTGAPCHTGRTDTPVVAAAGCGLPTR